MILAIDGPAASGKGTLARRLAGKYGLAYLDTGLLYRAVAHALTSQGYDPADETTATLAAQMLDPSLLDDPALRKKGVGEAASIVAALPAVRAALTDFQRMFASQQPGAVLDGRDIGTVICPDADVKLFITASAQERARRRFMELKGQGEDVTQDQVLDEIQRRDERDSSRATAPLKPADDAHLLDTTKLDIEAAFQAAVAIVDRAMKG